jgi:5-methyltetrahydropteroyltriglutamate--homocysteine methyltransferase
MHSTDRILTTHAGSLPRPNDVVEMVRARARGDRRDDAAARLREAVAEVVRKQADIGLDIVDDGEFGKPSFVTYVRERLGGLSEVGPARSNPWGGSRDALAFPDFAQDRSRKPEGGNAGPRYFRCVRAVDFARQHRELERKSLLQNR